jgi:hypothetical protein
MTCATTAGLSLHKPSARWSGCTPLEFVEIDAVAPVDLSERSGFKVVDQGLTDKFTIVRLSDGHVMAKGIETAERAHQEIRDTYVPRYMRRGFG